MSIGRNSKENSIIFPISDASQRNGSRASTLSADPVLAPSLDLSARNFFIESSFLVCGL